MIYDSSIHGRVDVLVETIDEYECEKRFLFECEVTEKDFSDYYIMELLHEIAERMAELRGCSRGSTNILRVRSMEQLKKSKFELRLIGNALLREIITYESMESGEIPFLPETKTAALSSIKELCTAILGRIN